MSKKFLTALILLGLVISCANRSRSGNPAISSEEVLALLNQVSAPSGAEGKSSTAGNSSLELALSLRDEPGVRIYFAQSKGKKSAFGTVASVLSFKDFSFLGEPGLTWQGIEEARVFFMDIPTPTGHRNSLIIGIRKLGQSVFNYSAFMGAGQIMNNQMVVTFDEGGLIARTRDVKKGDLTPFIQLNLSLVNGGVESRLGKISTLAGYGN